MAVQYVTTFILYSTIFLLFLYITLLMGFVCEFLRTNRRVFIARAPPKNSINQDDHSLSLFVHIRRGFNNSPATHLLAFSVVKENEIARYNLLATIALHGAQLKRHLINIWIGSQFLMVISDCQPNRRRLLQIN